MNRRNFFGWIAKLAAALGLGYLTANSDLMTDADAGQTPISTSFKHKIRMNGAACGDFRLMSNDRSILLDKDIFPTR